MKKLFISLFMASVLSASVIFGASCGCKHKLVAVEKVPSTCIKKGIEAHYKCENCNEIFADEKGEKAVLQSDLILPLLSVHDYEWTVDEYSHSASCTLCNDYIEEQEHQIVTLEKKLASYTQEGYEEGKICSACKYVLEGGEVIPAITPFRQKTFNNLNYCLYMPKISQGEKVPLVLFLHGAGERGSNNESQLANAILKVVNNNSMSKFMDAAVIAPQCPANEFWTGADHSKINYKLSKVSETELLKSVVSLVEEYKNYDYIDSSKIYVIGVSMGGFATWDLLARHSDLFAAGVPICGGGPTDAINTLKNIPIYTFHGVLDAMVPYKGTKNMVNLIKNAGGSKIYFKTYENDDHIIWDEAIVFEGEENLPSLEDWLFSQTK